MLGGIAFLGSLVVQIAAWIGAVINTNRLVDKIWYNVLLWCGLAAIVLTAFSGLGILIGWVLMFVYVVSGPDGMAVAPMLLRATPTLGESASVTATLPFSRWNGLSPACRLVTCSKRKSSSQSREG